MDKTFEFGLNSGEQQKIKDIENQWQNLLCKKYNNDDEKGNNADSFQKAVSVLSGLPADKQKVILKNVGQAYTRFILENSGYVKGTGIENEYVKFHNFNRQFGSRGDLLEFIDFSLEMREVYEQKDLPHIYVDEGHYPILFGIENRQKDLEQIFEKNNVDEIRKVLDFLVDVAYNTSYLKNVDAEQIEKYCQKTIEIVGRLENQTENYYLKIKSAQVIEEVRHLLDVGVKKISHEKGYASIFNKEIRRASVGVRKGYDHENHNKIVALAKVESAKGGEGIMKDVSDFSFFYNKKITERLKADVGLNVDALPEEQRIKAKLYTLSFLKKIKIDELEKYRQYFVGGESDDDVAERIKAFFSLEIDGENGDKIIEIGNSLDQKDAKIVFQKIAELADLVQEKDTELLAVMYKNSAQKELPEGVRTELLRRAHKIIVDFSMELESGEKTSQEKIAKLLQDLEQSRTEIDLVASLLIATKKAGEGQKLEEIAGVEMATVGEEDLEKDPVLASKLREMYASANAHKSKADLERLLGDFENHKEHEPRFHLVYFDKNQKSAPEKILDNLVGFMRSSSFDGQKTLPDGERYLGAMNIDPILQKLYFGENFLREVTEKEIAGGAKKLIAHVPEGKPSHKITKTLGFRDVKIEGDYRDDAGNVIAARIRVEMEGKS